MLPNVRLLIAAMLASVVVLICGFGVFAAFRVSHEPIAHLPAAMALSRLVADNEAASSAVAFTREAMDQDAEGDIPAAASAEPLPASTIEHQAERVAWSEPPATPEPIATLETEPSIGPEAEKDTAMPAPQEQSVAPSPSGSDLPALSQAGGRAGDLVSAAPQAPAADLPAAAGDTAAEDTAVAKDGANTTPADQTASGDSTATAEARPAATNAGAGREAEPAAVASIAVDATPDGAVEHRDSDALLDPPLPRARPRVDDAERVNTAEHVSHAPFVGHAPPTGGKRRISTPRVASTPRVSDVPLVGHARSASAGDERPRSTAAYKLRRARLAARSVRAARFANAYYYGQAQYAQNIDQSYGYGQSNFQGASVADGQTVIARPLRPRSARLAARKTNSAIGGPFVSVRGR